MGQAAMELLALEDKEQAKAGKKATGQCSSCLHQEETPLGNAATKERRKRQKNRKKEAAKDASAELQAAEVKALKASQEDMDEIDAEFNNRVLEHLRIRAEEAKKTGSQPQTDRGNAILKALCQKLKAQLESVDGEGATVIQS